MRASVSPDQCSHLWVLGGWESFHLSFPLKQTTDPNTFPLLLYSSLMSRHSDLVTFFQWGMWLCELCLGLKWAQPRRQADLGLPIFTWSIENKKSTLESSTGFHSAEQV